MNERTYVSVILPLRLTWNPCYYTEEAGRIVRGSRVRVLFARREYVGVVEAVGVHPSPDILDKVAPVLAVEDLPPVTEAELRLWDFVASYYLCSIGEVYRGAYPSTSVAQEKTAARIRERLSERIGRLEEKLAKARKESTRERYQAEMAAVRAQLAGKAVSYDAQAAPDLSPAQSNAFHQILQAFDNGKIVLLDGVTGSGKTELYVTLALQTLAQGRNVLYLVPEIALSRQLEDRLGRYFGEHLLTFHSGETIVHRQEVASTLRDGSYVVLGTRSALFLPHHDLGLIIVDEEHDTSYKQDTAPRYQGRDTAVMLGSIHGSHVILGSATPSLESLYNCENGRYVRVWLPEKYHGGPKASVEVIDTRAERRKNGMVGSFSRKLIGHISDTLSAGGQAVILRSRRSYAPAVQCSACGAIPKCPSCHVSLSWHKASGRLVCHHCGHQEPYTGICPTCGGPLEPLGAGTQRIEEELQELFPQARIARLDSDTAQSRTEETRIIRDFSEHRTDILVGTQIVTKGFDFEGLSLVAVLQADTLLGQQDFRADERAMQLLEQFRGRCARRGAPGLFVIQTAQAAHPVYQQMAGILPGPSLPTRSDGGRATSPVVSIAGNDFARRLLAERQAFGYPPYSRIIQLVIRDADEQRLDRMACALADTLCATFVIRPTLIAGPLQGSITLTGPYAPPIDKIAGTWIRHIRLTLRKDANLAPNKQLLAATLTRFETDHRYPGHIHPDVDPV